MSCMGLQYCSTTTPVVNKTKCKSAPFKYTISMLKGPTGSICKGSNLYNLIYYSVPLPRGLEVDPE